MQASISPNYTDRPRYLQMATILSFVVICVIVLIVSGSSSFLNMLLWAFMLLCIIGPVWLNPTMRQQAFHPYSYFVYAGLFTFAVPGLLVVAFPNVETMFMNQYPRAAILISGAFLGYWIGFSSSFGNRLARSFPLLVFEKPNDDHEGTTFWIVALLLYLIGWIGRMVSNSLGFSHLPIDLGEQWQLSGLFDYLQIFSTLSYMVMLYALLKQYKSYFWVKIACGILIVLEIMAGALMGGRSGIILPVLYFLMAYHFAVRHIRWRYIVVGYLFALIILVPILTVYRESYYKVTEQESYKGFESVQRALESSAEEIVAGKYESQELTKQVVFERGGYTFRGTLRVLDKVPVSYEYQLGDTFIPSLLILPIPRLIWPNKPVFLPTREFAKKFWEIETDIVYGTNVGIGMPAEAFYNFGWLGLLMFPILGLGLRVLFERYQMYQELETTYIVRAFFILTVVSSLTESFLGYFGGILRDMIVYLLFMVLINRRLPSWREFS